MSAGIVCLQGIRRLSPPAGSAALPSVTMPRRARPVNAQSVPTDPFTASLEVRTTGCVGDGRREEASLNRGISSLSGFGTQPCFPRIAPATCANDVPLETATNRSAPMACGPNVDQACPARGQRRSALADLPDKGDSRRLPRQASPAGNRLAGGALAGSGPGTSPYIDGLSLVSGMVVAQHPACANPHEATVVVLAYVPCLPGGEGPLALSS